MSWQDILKEDNELDKEVKVVLEGVQDFEYSTDFRDPQHLFEVCYKLYKEKGLEGLIEYLESVQYRQERKIDYANITTSILELKDIIEELKRLI